MNVFTRTLAAADSITIVESQGVSYISVLCKTDNSGTRGITILGSGGIAGTASNEIILLENESITIQSPSPYDVGGLTITAGTGSTGRAGR